MKTEALKALQRAKEEKDIREALLESFVSNAGMSPSNSHPISLDTNELDFWVFPENYFTKIELAILQRIEDDGSESLWATLDVRKLEASLAIARNFKGTKAEEVAA
jgi:hypothetical protein